MVFKTILVAAVLTGPPAPEVDLLHHFRTETKTTSHLKYQLPLQVLAAGFDLYTTHRCLNKSTCYESNPLANSSQTPYILKGATAAVVAGLTIWMDKTNHHRISWFLTGLSVVVQSVFAIHNMRY